MQQYRYDAFISYRHLPHDMAVAERLQKLLEGYRPPRGVAGDKASRRVFRDQSELPVSSDLGRDIELALSESRFLVVICTPELMRSRWCLAEIDYFKSLHGGSCANILAVLASGDPGSAFPPALLSELRPVLLPDGSAGTAEVEREPLAANVAAGSTKQSLKLLKTEFLRVAAPMLGCRFDDLYRRHRRRAMRRLAVTVAGGFAAVAAAFALVLGSVQSANSARLAARQAELMRSQGLALQSSQQLSDGDRAQALRLALESIAGEGAPPPAAYGALVSALYSGGHGRAVLRHASIIADTRAGPDGSLIATAAGGHVHVWDAATGELLLRLPTPGGDAVSVAFSGEGDMLAAADAGGKLTVFDSRTGDILSSAEIPQPAHNPAVFFCGGAVVAVHDFGAFILGQTGAAGTSMEGSFRYLGGTPQGRHLLIRDGLGLWLEPGANGAPVAVDAPGLTLPGDARFAMSADGARLLAITDGQIALWDTAAGRELAALERVWEYGFVAGCLLPDGRAAISCSDNYIRIYSSALEGPVLSLYGHTGLCYALVPGDGALATGSYDGAVRIWDTTLGTSLAVIDAGGAVYSMTPITGGSFAVTLRGNRALVLDFEPADPSLLLAPGGAPVSAWFEGETPVVALNGGNDAEAFYFDAHTGGVTGSESVARERALYWESALEADRRFILAADGLSIKLVGGPQLVPGAQVISADVSAGGTLCAVLCDDNRVSVWDAATGERITIFDGPVFGLFDIAFMPAGDIIYGTAADGTVLLWEARSGAVLSELAGMGDMYFPVDGLPGSLYSAMTGRFLNVPEIPNYIEHIYPARVSADGRWMLRPAAGGARLCSMDVERLALLAGQKSG